MPTCVDCDGYFDSVAEADRHDCVNKTTSFIINGNTQALDIRRQRVDSILATMKDFPVLSGRVTERQAELIQDRLEKIDDMFLDQWVASFSETDQQILSTKSKLELIAVYLVNQREEPFPGSDSKRLHYWRDKAILAAEQIRLFIKQSLTPSMLRGETIHQQARKILRSKAGNGEDGLSVTWGGNPTIPASAALEAIEEALCAPQIIRAQPFTVEVDKTYLTDKQKVVKILRVEASSHERFFGDNLQVYNTDGSWCGGHSNDSSREELVMEIVE